MSDRGPQVIKYAVVIMKHWYSSYTLVEIHTHDIKVVAALTRHDPAAPDPDGPEESHGNVDGCHAEAEPLPAARFLPDDIQRLPEEVVAWWEGWWPRIHLSLTVSTPAGGTATLHVSVELLCDSRVEGCETCTPVDDRMTSPQEQSWAAHVAGATAVESIASAVLFLLSVALLLGLGAVDACMTMCMMGPAARVALMAGHYVTWSQRSTLLLVAYGACGVTVDFVVGVLGAWWAALTFSMGPGTHAFILQVLWHVSENLSGKLREIYCPRLLRGMASAAFNSFIVGSMQSVWIEYFETSVKEFTEVQR